MEDTDDITGRSIGPCRKIVCADGILHDDITSPLGAYATLILDVLHGTSTNFVRADELLASWRIFTPLLHEYERNSQIRPLIYTAGSSGPEERSAFLQSKARSSL
jgi:glucose-6-phosphate 1-dehydrogenase